MGTRHILFELRLFCSFAVVISSCSKLSAATFNDADWVSLGGVRGANGQVRAAVADGLGNVYIGGDFTVVGDVVANHIAQWKGRSWSGLGSGMDGSVSALAVSGNDVYAGGDFIRAGGIPVWRIAKWNGSAWSALGLDMGGPPGHIFSLYSLAVSGSDLYAGGFFQTGT